MGVITADGVRLWRHGADVLTGNSHVVVAIGDRVKLFNGWTGTAHNWSKRGVAVQLDHAVRWHAAGVHVWAIDAGDGDIAGVIDRYADRVEAMVEKK